MRWVWKAFALMLGVILLSLGAWQLGLLVLAVLFIPPILRSRRGRGGGAGTSQGAPGPRRRFPARYILVGFFFFLALLGVLAQGVYSPVVFAALGTVVLLWGRVRVPLLSSGMRPVDESILLRSSPLPFSWAAVAEVKLITRDVGRALAGLRGTVLVAASESPSVYVMFETTATTERSAEEAVVAALKDTVPGLSALGAYLLPLDSQQALALLRPSMEASKMEEKDWSTTLGSGAYDLLSIKQDKGFARALGIYRRFEKKSDGKARVPRPSEGFAHPPFLMEVFKALGNRVAWPHPDQYTAFLSSLTATGSQPVGTRILEGGAASQAQMVVVRSQGSPPVELSRAQLRAVVRIYDRET